MWRRGLTAALIVGFVAAPAAEARQNPSFKLWAAADRSTEPVVLTGASFPGWAVPADVSAKLPTTGGLQCLADDSSPACTHNQYEAPDATTGAAAGSGVPVDHLLGYRWDGHAFVQIPFQVDEMAVRYISNNASGFAAYSETDAHPTYVFDEERFRWTASAPGSPCQAAPGGGVRTTPDPVPGLDTNDELSFMASDAGLAAPASAPMPPGIVAIKRVRLVDPYHSGAPHFVYVMQAGDGPGAPRPAFDATSGYVRYQPDADSDTFIYSQSSYGDYGNAPKGPYMNASGTCITDPAQWKQRRPKDTAWVTTSRYGFRYDGRWLMTQLRIAPRETPWIYGPDIIDQWKARAFQQRPGGETPCCGYEDEQVNWGGSSITMGVRSGPVRVIRATWGADSGTNTVRVETFYRDEIRQDAYLRVHPVPPGDGIYSQWDYNATKVSTYYNPYVPKGVPIDGRSDEVFGNSHVTAGQDPVRFDNDVDIVDPTLSGPHGALSYEEVTGPYGTIVSRFSIKQPTAGSAYTLATFPYYRDDSCFDDGTGSDPGIHVRPRQTDSPLDSTGQPRVCWTPADGDPSNYAPDHFFQGDIGTQGVHVEIIPEADNAFLTVPITEVDSDQRIVVLPGRQPNVGEQFGRGTEKPLVAIVEP